MPRRRFTDQQLFSVRNHIPIRQVIESLLSLPSKMDQGVFRFACPLCARFNTAIHIKTNLARCFDCEKNFNPIDIMMTVRQTDFVETVTFLLDYQRRFVPPDNTSSQDHGHSPIAPPVSPNKSERGLIPIGHILPELVEKIKNANWKANTDHMAPSKRPSPDDISKLGQVVETLTQLLQELKSQQ
jgi:hypothetical protein